MSSSHGEYYIPEPSQWPVVGSIALFTSFVGAAMMLNGSSFGTFVLGFGIALVVYMFVGWFSDVIDESLAGSYNKQVDISFRWGMGWFIFSEVMFFAAFFGALFYIRAFSIPWLGGDGSGFVTNQFLWQDFVPSWPIHVMPDPSKFDVYEEVIPWNDLPLINTIILLASGVTVTIAHHALKHNNRSGLCWWLLATVLLGFLFVYLQASEYHHAYEHLNLKLSSGAYGSTFYMLTGFHGFHVTMGATMLLVIYFRSLKGHFTPESHFAFEGVAWYWHFVDVVWLGLFIFVYMI